MSWWNEAGARVVTCDCRCDGEYGDCGSTPDYGPHRTMQRDRTGHVAFVERITSPEHPRGWPVAVCECGWRNFPTNYYEHLAEVTPLVEVLS